LLQSETNKVAGEDFKGDIKAMSIQNILINKVIMRTHNPKVTGSNPVPATKQNQGFAEMQALFLLPIANLQDIIP